LVELLAAVARPRTRFTCPDFAESRAGIATKPPIPGDLTVVNGIKPGSYAYSAAGTPKDLLTKFGLPPEGAEPLENHELEQKQAS
jgi:hypothetical protein